MINSIPTASCSAPTRCRRRAPRSGLKIYEDYAPLLAKLDPRRASKFLKGNYERLFDAAQKRVRAWEKANVPS